MPAGPVQYSLDGNIARILFDDGKANALSHDALDALSDALDRAASEANCVLWLGRPGRFSAGFDLRVMSQGRRAITELVAKGAKLALRVYESPVPVVLGVTGHALAMGAILLMAADRRIGTAGNFKIGLNEVAIGMTLPDFGIEFAKARLHHCRPGRIRPITSFNQWRQCGRGRRIDRAKLGQRFAGYALCAGTGAPPAGGSARA